MEKMKKRNVPLAILLAIVCLLTAGGGLKRFFASADVSVTLDNAYTTENVALGKTAKYTTIAGEEIPREQLLYLHRTSDSGNTDFNPYTALTDGDHDPNDKGSHDIVNVVQTDGTELRSFAVIDLEQGYTITGVNVDLWHDHQYIEVVVQIANSEDFSDAVTIYNNDTQNEMKQGAGSGDALQNQSGKGTLLPCTPVFGRYVRVSGRDGTSGGVKFTEVEVYGVTEGLAPVAGNLALEKQNRNDSLTLTTELEDATIYYTTDGKMPTEESTEYTAPIQLASAGFDKALIRAIAVKDGVATLPSDFKFDISEQSRNVALGVTPTFDEGAQLGFERDGSVDRITDGEEQSWDFAYSTGKAEWLYLDLGDVYKIHEVRTKFWNDHSFTVVIQTATNADFTEGLYTVFNNDRANASGAGKGLDANYKDKGASGGSHEYRMTEFTFAPVEARYVRVYNADLENGLSKWEEIQVWNTDKPDAAYDIPAKNVALGITPTFDAADEDKVKVIDGTTSLETITDGYENSWGFMGSSTSVWLYLDLGKNYEVDKVYTKLYNNHAFTVVMQLATNREFTENVVTIFNNDAENRAGAGAGTDGTYLDTGVGDNGQTPTHLQEFTFDKTEARYFRIWCQTQNGSWGSSWEELQVWSAVVPGQEIPEEQYPEIESAIVKATGIGDFTVPNGATTEDFADKLPATLSVEDYLGNKGSVTGAWACADYNATTAGTYDFVFTADPSNLVDTYQILKVTVTVAAPADKTALNAAIAAAAALEEDKYLSDSWATLTDPLAAAREVAAETLLFQSQADKAAEDLQAAIDALILRGDKTALSAMLTQVAALNASEYSAASWAALQAEITSAQVIADSANVTQTVVDLALADLTAARDALQKLGDKTALTARYNELKDTQNIHTQASWASFAAALAEAKEVLDKAEAYEGELTAALTKLNTAFAALTVKADFAALNASVAAAKAKDLAAYTSATVAALTESLTAAEAIAANDESTQTAIDAAKADLDAKVAALVAKGDKTELNALLATCNYAQDRYTASSYNAYLAAKEAADTAAANADAVQSELDAAKTALSEKIAALKELGDKTALLAAVAAAKQINEAGYTAASFAAFEEALTYAESVAASNDVEQTTVDEALADLTAKKNALEKDNSGTTTPDPEKPDPENPDPENPDPEKPDEKKDDEGCGCGSRVSLLGSIPAAIVLLLAAAVLIRKKSKA